VAFLKFGPANAPKLSKNSTTDGRRPTPSWPAKAVPPVVEVVAFASAPLSMRYLTISGALHERLQCKGSNHSYPFDLQCPFSS
jgi:hypothetical protein